MGALFPHIKVELNTRRQHQPVDVIYFSEIPFADDTLTHCVNILLHAIERHSVYYGLGLNYGKCANFTANQSNLRSHSPAPGPAQEKELGRLPPNPASRDTFDNRAEVPKRNGDCIATCNRVKLFWNKASSSIKGKVQSFHRYRPVQITLRVRMCTAHYRRTRYSKCLRKSL